MMRRLLITQGTGSAQYVWTPTGFQLTGTARLYAPAFGSNLPGLVPTGSNAGLFLKDDGTWDTPSVGAAASGLTLAQLAPLPPSTIVGRYSAGSGIAEALTPTMVATMLPAFTVTGKGVVPPPGSVAGLFLKDDGTWDTPVSAPGGGVPTMLAVGPTGAVQFNSGSGFGGSSGFSVQGAYPSLTVRVIGAVHVPTGEFRAGSSVRVTPTGIDAGSTPIVGVATLVGLDASLRSIRVSSGIPNTELSPMASGTVKGQMGADGIPQDIPLQSLTTALYHFDATNRGVVPLSGGNAAHFIDAVGTWRAPSGAHQFPTSGGVTNLQMAVMPTGTVKANLTGNAVPSDVPIATLLAFAPTFTAARAGAFPASSLQVLPTGLDASSLHITVKSITTPSINGLPTDHNILKRGIYIGSPGGTGVPSGLSLYAPGTVSTGANRFIIPSGYSTVSNNITLSPTGAKGGAVVRVERLDPAGTLNFVTPTGTILYTMPSGVKHVADFVFTKPSGPNFEHGGQGDLF